MKRKILVTGSIVMTVVTLVVIWALSDQNVTQSGALLDELVWWLRKLPIVELLLRSEENKLILRKILHAVVYMALGFSMSLALSEVLSGRKLFGCAVILGMLYAVTDELHQGFVPGRFPSARDVLIDLGGLLIGISVGVWIKNKCGELNNPGRK